MATTSSFNQYFPGYEILGELGRGNARVLKARDKTTGELVAIKHFAFNTDADTLRRFQRESEIMTSIQHRYMVKIIDVHLDAELPYLVMELIEGGDLRTMINDQKILDVTTTIRLAQQMTEALEAIHANKVVHRDIKPENIMYRRLPTGELHFLLTDFGIAKLREQSGTVTGSSMLTFEYASPEQFNNSKLVGAATDYYSLGVVLYECLTGRVPFAYEEENLLSHINQVISHPVPPIHQNARQVPRPLINMVYTLLAKQAQDRLTDPVQMRYILKNAAIADMQGAKAGTSIFRPSFKQTLKAPAPANNAQTKPAPQRMFVMAVALLLTAFLGMGAWLSYDKHTSSWQPDKSDSVDSYSATRRTDTFTTLARNKPIIHTIKRSSNAVETVLMSNPTDQGLSLTDGLYYEDFSDPFNTAWDQNRDSEREFSIENGKYVVRGFKSGYSYESTYQFNTDIQKDFSVTASVTWLEGNTEEGFGINYCANVDSESYFVFYITAGGYYQITSFADGEWTTLVDWTKSNNIHTGSAYNTLSIVKENGMVSYYINDRKEQTMEFRAGYGNSFGIRVDGQQSVAFDQFIVKGVQ